MPVFSLPSKYGIGTMGAEAKRFIDFLNEAGQKFWQILPLNPAGLGASPYQSFAGMAGNPLFIDLDWLIEKGFLNAEQLSGLPAENNGAVNYAAVESSRKELFKKAFTAFLNNTPPDFEAFKKDEEYWLKSYAVFMAAKEVFGDGGWQSWPNGLNNYNESAVNTFADTHRNTVEYYNFLQYVFFKQWQEIKEYANGKGVNIIGDMPIYVSLDSADVWANRGQFELDSAGNPPRVAGCPPDAFSEDGQKWGMPLYNYKKMAAEPAPYSWWRARIKHAFRFCNYLRIDHFRGFESYYAIPADAENAKNGIWEKGPGEELFKYVKADLGKEANIIAEDLGTITPAVEGLLKATGFPGMKVLQFAFTPFAQSSYLPHNHTKNSVVYTGTHDNNTIIGWEKEDPAAANFAKKYLGVQNGDSLNWVLIKAAMMSVADICIVPMADFMGLDETARINIPGTVSGNWVWRIDGGCINSWLAGIIRDTSIMYNR